MAGDKKTIKDSGKKNIEKGAGSDLCCCYVVDPCGCYTDPCGCFADPCGCYADPYCCR